MVSLVTIVALAGTPAFAAACASLCMPVMDHGSSTATTETANHHDTHGSMNASEAPVTTVARDAQAAGHHHAVVRGNERPRSAFREGAVKVVTASDRSCCTSDDTVLTASVVAVRIDPGALLATAAVLATSFHSQIPLLSDPKSEPPVAQPSATRAPLVLRI